MKFNLSEINEIIRSRRTIKPESFSTRKVHKEIVMNLLENARWAPTHGMTQPWKFTVFLGEEAVRKFGEFHSNTYKRITPENEFNEKKQLKLMDMALQTSAIIAIGVKVENPKIPEIEEVSAVACAVQNMMLTATAYGIGSFWASGGLTYTHQMKEFLGLGEKDKCLGFLYLGYPNTEWPKGQRRPIEYFTNWVE